MPEKLFSAKQAARELLVGTRRVSYLAKNRKVGRKIGNVWIFTKSDIIKMTPGKTGGGKYKKEGQEMYCEYCNKRLVRNKYPSGHFENMNDFKNRGFCNASCRRG